MFGQGRHPLFTSYTHLVVYRLQRLQAYCSCLLFIYLILFNPKNSSHGHHLHHHPARKLCCTVGGELLWSCGERPWKASRVQTRPDGAEAAALDSLDRVLTWDIFSHPGADPMLGPLAPLFLERVECALSLPGSLLYWFH